MRAMSSRAPSERPPRIRRTAEEAQTAILDATEKRLVEAGPSGIRLQDVAEDVGVSHPTILHHFGSRERLVGEVIKRRVASMNAEVLATLAAGTKEEATVTALFERLFTAFGPGGHARVVAFLALAGERVTDLESVMPLAETLQTTRLANCTEGKVTPTLEDSYFTVLLVSFALFGDAIAGRLFRAEPDPEIDRVTSERFRVWLARLVQSHLER